MGDDLRIQLLRYRGTYGGLTAALLACGVATAVWHDQEAVLITGSLLTMVLWCFACAYAAYEVFRVLHAADDYLLLSVPGGGRAAVLVRGLALLIWLAVLAVVEVGCWAAAWVVRDAGPSAAQIAYAAGTRAVSLTAFLALAALLALATKPLRARTWALISTIGVLTGLVIAIGALQLALVRLQHPDYFWTMGIDTEYVGISQYAAALPLAMRPRDLTSVAQTVLPVTAAVNLAAIGLAAAIWWPLRRQRLNLP